MTSAEVEAALVVARERLAAAQQAVEAALPALRKTELAHETARRKLLTGIAARDGNMDANIAAMAETWALFGAARRNHGIAESAVVNARADVASLQRDLETALLAERLAHLDDLGRTAVGQIAAARHEARTGQKVGVIEVTD